MEGDGDKRLVMVEWTDAGCSSDWQTSGSVVTPYKVRTTGWLLHEEPDFIMVVATMVPSSGDFNQSMSIPRGMVLSIKDISGE